MPLSSLNLIKEKKTISYSTQCHFFLRPLTQMYLRGLFRLVLPKGSLLQLSFYSCTLPTEAFLQSLRDHALSRLLSIPPCSGKLKCLVFSLGWYGQRQI